ncbi:MAG: multicopper oxidase domain-containing protein, partial [Anaerolineales bacterium]|nr:multicopper oxidase domain-containing protein [Anaerolineales bacterium]
MRYRRLIKIRYLFYLSMVLLLLGGVSSQANAQRGGAPVDQTGSLTTQQEEAQKITPADRQQAAARASALGQNQVGMGEAAMAAPGAAPHYFSHPNYANSPLPVLSGAVIAVGNPLVERAYATDFNAASPVPVLVVLPDAVLPDGLVQSFEIFNQTNPGGSPGPSEGNLFHAYILRPTGIANEYYVVFDSGEFMVPPSSNPAGEVTSFPVPDIAVLSGDIIAYYGAGVPVDITATGTDILSFPAPAAPVADTNITLGGTDFPVYPQARTYSFSASVLDLSGANTVYAGGIRKFVDGLAGLGAAGANNLGQYISVAVPDTTSYPGSDYYEIAVIEFTEQMHSDLPATTHRGYIQLSTAEVPGIQVPLANPDGSPILMPDGSQAYGVDNPHYLGASIVAQKDRPVRIKFYNLLPTGHYDPNTGLRGGDLFLPVDTSVMGSGMGPEMYDTVNGTMMMEPDPQNPMCGNPDKPYGCYTENRATLHLHGGISPWISDGTPHQWITPADENTPYPQGVSVQNVPDMTGCELATDGCMTFYYTNQQSARLSFYHDHAWGITRLNVYAGEAAAYLIRDETEQALIDNGTIPSVEIPLVIQDKTFVPSEEQLAISDETWDINRWGGFGSLWFPHVYSPAQNPGDASGVNQYGRWAYGPWFWPPTNAIEHGPIDNPYYDPNCNPDLEWCEPALMPGTPYNSMGMEAFNDTPTVNGTVYPTITLEPQAYRFRILSVANDRFFNLSLYRAVDANGNPCDLSNPNPAPESTGVTCTEVALNPDEVAAALTDPAGVFPTPLAGTEGPSWIQIGSEGGFLPTPAIVPPHPITWVTDPTVFNAGNVDQHSLLLGPAERADVIVDFSAYAGQTLILYNDAPAAFPARDPRYDYYTGNPDLRDTGGAPSTLPGYGPNIRTVMQIRIADATPAPAYDVAALESAFTHQADGSGVFESGQNPIIVGQGAYNDAYGTSFQNNGPLAGLVQIFDTSFSFNTLLGNTLTMPLQSKQIQDEMGEAFGHMYGRMSGFMGVETPNPQAGLQNMILMGYINPPTEVLDGVEVGGGDFNLEVTPIAVADDGTQIWKITHNGVDTHPVHWHLYDVQLINRVGWDGIVRKPDPNELGWKDTIRVSPLEDTIVAVRPIIPHFPFEIPNSVRLLDPSMPEGAYIANTTAQEAMGLPIFAFAPNGEPIDIINHYINFGWEYVWHCHILSHEEMDMMRPQVVGVAPPAPTDLALALAGDMVTLTWTDNSINETGFVIERATDAAFTTGIRSFTIAADETTFVDSLAGLSGNFYYRVQGINVVGDTWDYSDPNLNEGASFPTKTIASEFTAAVAVEIITAPTNLVATLVGNTQVDLNWTDNSGNETGFTIERCTGAGCTDFAAIASVGADVTAYSDSSVTANTTYVYRVFAFNANVNSLPSNEVTITTTIQVPPGVYFSILGLDAIPGVPAPHDDADIYAWDNTAFGRSFDASAAGLLASADIDGMAIVDANHFYLSFIPDTDLPGLGTVQDEDVVYYDNGV